ncbi:MAG: FMN-binding negative transcriptional regulator [Pseudoxanthomonas sp.]
MGHARDRRFAARDTHDVLRLLASHPLAWLVSAGGDDACFTPLPLRAQLDHAGQLVGLMGHMARRNPHVARLARDPSAVALVLGPHAYVSPSWLDDRTQAPTWNYTAAVFQLEVTLSEAPQDIADELDALVNQMEAGRDRAWAMAEMGARYEKLAAGVTALRAEITGLHTTFKLGQDEAPHDFAQIIAGLVRGEEHALVALMQDFAASERGATP